METRKLTAKLSTPETTKAGPPPALRARTRRIVEPIAGASSSATPRPSPLRRTSERNPTTTTTSYEGMAPRRAVVRAATSLFVGEKSGSELSVRRAESAVGITNPRVRRDEPSGRARVSSPVPLRTDPPRGMTGSRIGAGARRDERTGQSTSRRSDTTSRIPPTTTTLNHNSITRGTDPLRASQARDPAPLSPLATLRRDELANVSPRSGRREAGRKVRAAVADVSRASSPAKSEPASEEEGDAESQISSMGSNASSNSTASSAEEEPPPALPPLVISAEIRRQILDEEDAKRSRKVRFPPFPLFRGMCG